MFAFKWSDISIFCLFAVFPKIKSGCFLRSSVSKLSSGNCISIFFLPYMQLSKNVLVRILAVALRAAVKFNGNGLLVAWVTSFASGK